MVWRRRTPGIDWLEPRAVCAGRLVLRLGGRGRRGLAPPLPAGLRRGRVLRRQLKRQFLRTGRQPGQQKLRRRYGMIIALLGRAALRLGGGSGES